MDDKNSSKPKQVSNLKFMLISVGLFGVSFLGLFVITPIAYEMVSPYIHPDSNPEISEVQVIMQKYPHPNTLYIAIQNGDVDYDSLPPVIQQMMDRLAEIKDGATD